jgi:cyclopropane fatty-acyl-phospholipid synthase-like methyltransferase
LDVAFDPHARETAALLDLTGPLAGKTVLEIGCGDGRLTWRYASEAARVVGIDPDGAKVAQAIQDRPLDLREKVQFLAADLPGYALVNPARRFDLSILSWSL